MLGTSTSTLPIRCLSRNVPASALLEFPTCCSLPGAFMPRLRVETHPTWLGPQQEARSQQEIADCIHCVHFSGKGGLLDGNT